MATLFLSFRSSSMPKRLLRYALSRLELLDAEALDMENLDFALGRNTVLEFRDVGIKLKKLEKLLKLPAAFRLQKAKVLLLRVTIPMDFYTSPIIIEVDGVDVRLKVGAERHRPGQTPTAASHDADAVPNTVDLAQSFLETQPSSERKQLEEALVAETQDLGASVTVSDDGSDDEPAFGTGQALSLPEFLADFLQGIVDRMQIKIKAVKFQLDMDVPADTSASTLEPVSFQVALEGIEVEGVTAQAQSDDAESPVSIVPKEGKRHVSLANVRAYLISEANVFSALTRSPSMASPSAASSPAMTRNPPSRQTTSLSQGSFHEQPMASLQESFREYLSKEDAPEADATDSDALDPEDPLGDGEVLGDSALGDSEEALGIPYDFEEDPEDESLPTPRASVFQEFNALPENPLPEESLFHSTMDAAQSMHSTASREQQESFLSLRLAEAQQSGIGDEPTVASLEHGSSADLAESHLYTHEEAESMYMSAFSNAGPRTAAGTSLVPSHHQKNEPPASTAPQPPPSVMPGAWDDESESCKTQPIPAVDSHPALPEPVPRAPDSGTSSPAFSRASLHENPAETADAHHQGDVATPKGPTRVVKEIMHLKNVSIYIPSHHPHIQVQAASPESVAQLSQSLDTSIYPQAPGAFSLHGSSASPLSPPVKTSNNDRTLEVVLSPLSVHFDASLGFLLAMVVEKLLAAVKDGYPAAESRKESKTAEIRVTAQDISLNFLNRLGGVADTPERYLDPAAFMFDHEVLLNATLQNLTLSVSPTDMPTMGKSSPANQDAVLTRIDVERFRFGYANGDIISFDSGRPMSMSVRDTFLTSGYDIGIKMLQSAGSRRTDVETLPLVVQVDLQRLDETFGWFGGLSSFLNMSASMTSSPSPNKSTAPPAQKPRGVRFETPIDPEDRSAAAQNKLNVRVGGALVELVGKDCSVAAETNTIKVVSRDEGIGVACSRIRVSGPYLRNSLADPAITTEVGGVRLEFLMAPKDRDLEKLLELIMPSKVKFDDGSDDIMVDTLLRQRRKGSVLRATVDTVNVRVKNLAQLSPALANLGEEVAKLSTVAKYLPEDDRPGLLTLAKLQKLSVAVDVGGQVGHVAGEVRDLEVGHITVPSLVAVAVHGVSIRRNKIEDLVSSPVFDSPDALGNGPVVMARMIGDEMEPTVKLKLQDLRVEYRVPTIMDVLGLAADATPQDFEASLAASVASLGEQAHATLAQPQLPSTPAGKPMTLDVGLRDCLVGLNPLNLTSKMVVAFTDAHVQTVLPNDGKTTVTMNINKASILLTDDVSATETANPPASSRRRLSSAVSPQVVDMCSKGFVDICYISSASVAVKVNATPDGDGDSRQVDVELRDDLLVLETCADSTQTLITLANALKPPTPPSKENKYRTKVVPVQDLLASISAEAFGKPEGEYDFDQDFAGAQEMAGSGGSDVDYGGDSLRVDSQYYGEHSGGEEMFDATRHGTTMQDTAEGVLLTGFNPSQSEVEDSGDDLVIHEDFYSRDDGGRDHAAKVWNSAKNTYDQAPDALVRASPLTVSVRDVHIIWNLFDGYDWAHTREVITRAVEDVETKAIERQSRPHVYEEELEDEETIGDFLFNSIYIGVPANRDPRELTRAINEGLNDNATETESVATTALNATTNRTARHHRQSKSRRLRLNRSRHHKITFELQGVNADVVVFPPAGETLSSIDVRVQSLDIFDHVPTSTWKKFATYDQDQGEREMGTSMVHLELLNVKPLPELAASEIVMRATVLPLRLHVDQDALDFITRFFEFKDEDVPVHSSPSDVPFLQRAEVNDIPVKLDFKPKRVDYAGLRSGHTTEFMNFIVLEEARMVMRHVIIYGVSGFDRLGKTLNDIWMPDVRKNQLPGVVAGLAPVRSLVNIGSGFRDLVEIPLREYQKDGRVIRSISKGAAAFARTTGTELVKLGAKIAVGTQYALQGAEEMLTDKQQQEAEGWDDDDLDAEDRKQISLYADQPTGVLQGIRGGYRSLTRDVNLARDAIIAVPGELMESQTAGGVARAVLKRAPTIIFRPAVGVTKAIGQTLMGATNTIDPHNRRRIGEKYKH
ncbi:Autophagy-like protein 2 [Tolypocladium ophioglossoides CBS 100239]|uniref:Autophagy-related protein 2 n=1 Tax=Tolypocladium ophioglossoides (strain CBS 100239) TaxID=1163406 RepID=A0A0L0N2S4_TOLOC|nr:Autophagy-like protein 2 [Tolypocladium ophioglossoides CBS 100239]